MRRTLGSRLPLPRLSRCLSSTILDPIPQRHPKKHFPDAPRLPDAEVDPNSSSNPNFRFSLGKQDAEVDASHQLERSLRNKGSIDATLQRTLSEGPKSVDISHLPEPKKDTEDASHQLQRKLRNKGSIDTTLQRTLSDGEKDVSDMSFLLELKKDTEDASYQLQRKLRNKGSIDATLQRTLKGARGSRPPKQKEATNDASHQFQRKLRNEGTIDATQEEQSILRTTDSGASPPLLKENFAYDGPRPFGENWTWLRGPESQVKPSKNETTPTTDSDKVDTGDELARALDNKGSVNPTLVHSIKAHLSSTKTNENNGKSSIESRSLSFAELTEILTAKKGKKQKSSPSPLPVQNEPISAPTKKPKKTKPTVQKLDSAYLLLDTLQKAAISTPTGWGWGLDTLQPTDEAIGTAIPTDHDSAAAAKDEPSGTAETETPQPQLESKTKTRLDRPAFAPHQPQPSLSYSRRIEGLIEPMDSPTLETVEPPSEQYPIARLSHGLDRVLFNPGIHWLQDPRSKVYNFPPYLEVIPKVTDFAFERLGSFIKSSRDNDLWELARREKRTFAGSTSSLSGMLSHVYFLLSGDKEVNTDNLSRHFGKEPRDFTSGQRMPASVVLNHRDGRYAIDSDNEKDKFADKNILTWMGTLLEKFLTSTPEEFAPYMRFNPPPPTVEKRLRDAYRFAKSEKFVMRSQLDCVDPRLPGTGVFDVKTRACLPIRMDLLNFEENSGYLLRSQTGKMESFEREYYDLIRSAFLKYSFQVRIGNMDGVIVAYHNTAQIFGFQYISLQEMDEAIFGSGEGVGDRVFDKCVKLLEKVLEEATGCFPGETVKCTFEKLDTNGVMNVWVQQETPKEDGPIYQLEVKVSNFLGQMPVRGSTAVASINEPWTMHWSISKLAGPSEDIHLALDAAKARQFRYIDIPTGLDASTVGAMWSALNFGGVKKTAGSEEMLPSHYFKEPGARTQELRDLARAGRADTEKRVIEEEGQAKVWVNGRVEWTELQRVLDMFRMKEIE